VDVDVAELKEQSEAVEQALVKMLAKMEEAAREQAESDEGEGEEEANGEEEGSEEEAGENVEAEDKNGGVDEATERRIDRMFERAKKDHSQAFGLKKELDRLGVFKKYEDRFLDLFKKAG
ncbi:MAG TPA: hypothetical protein VG711_12035, partial [Phycisphaerales bacterium]|nr:hypothetical protein [Phycisphaerales bacterium]